jgi:outer membrane receptor protein involved in Fe transport
VPLRLLLAVVVASVLAVVAVARAQDAAGSLGGRVSDETGGALGHVSLSASSREQHYAAVSDADGRYSIPRVAPGSYVITAKLFGFAPEMHTGVVVRAGEVATFDLTLQPRSMEELMAIEVTSASKLEEKSRQAPGVVGVVTRDDLERYGWISLNDILYKQAGFGPAQDYDRHTLAARGQFEGWNNNHILHLVDGIPMNDNLYGTAYTWEITPLFLAKNVEILRGPGSALYGSNASNGVVQVNTLSARDLDGKAEGRVRLGSAATRIYDVIAGFGAGRLVSGVIGYNAFRTDGNEYASRDGSGRTDAAGNLATFLTNDRRESRYVTAKLEGSQSLDGLSLQYHDQYWKFQSGHGWLWWIPDVREAMAESRQIVSLRYRRQVEGRVSHEYLARYQRHDIDYTTRYYPNGAFAGRYPAGAVEHLATRAEDVFGRAQLTWKLAGRSTLILGLEGDRFFYGGDSGHDSTIDVDAAAHAPFPDNRPTPVGPWLDYVLEAPITNLAFYTQYATRGRAGGALDVTLGARYDRTSFDYHDILAANRPDVNKEFSSFSPRVAVVLFPTGRVSVKLLGGRAFRAPSPTELAGAHTLSLASNIAQLRPERIATGELAADWKVSRYLGLRANVFVTRFENQIAYSAENLNLSTNLYTLDTTGFEAEALLSRGALSGFLNYSYAQRLDERIIDRTITPSTDRLTWDPSQRANLGIAYARRQWTASVSGHYQGSVARRASDVGVQVLPLNVVSVDLDRYRPRTLGAWLTLDATLGFKLPRNLSASVIVRNLTDTRSNTLVKVLAFPFDYRQEGRRCDFALTVAY